jgi:hypothetical protein
VLIRSPNEGIVGRARAAPTKIGDRLRHQSISAEWERGGGAKEFSAALWRRRWIVGEQFRNDPLQESTGACEGAAEDHSVAERRRSWPRPEAPRECSGDALGLCGSCRNGDAACGAPHINAKPRIGEASANYCGESVVHSCGDRHTSRETKICSWPREQRSDLGARKYFGRERALIKACRKQGAALGW